MEILNFEKKDVKRKFNVRVDMLDGNYEEHVCSYFGFDIPGYLVFVHRDLGPEEYTWPDYFLKEELIKSITVSQGEDIETNTN